MSNPTPDFHRLAAELPCEEELLPELGRVAWAAARLRSEVHAVLQDLRGPDPAPSRWPSMGPSLAENVRELESITEETIVAEWCRSVAANAISAHDAVVHEVVHGTPRDDGCDVARPPQRRGYGCNEVIEVTGRLANAANVLATHVARGDHTRTTSPDRARSAERLDGEPARPRWCSAHGGTERV